MGLYTWVAHECTCGERIEFQSKVSNKKDWGDWDTCWVPVDVAKDIEGDIKTCPKCDRNWVIRYDPLDVGYVPMVIEPI